MQSRKITFCITLLAYSVLAFATSGCKLKLINGNREPTGELAPPIDSPGPSVSMVAQPGIAIVAGGGFASGTGVKLRVTIGETATTQDLTGTGVKLRLGLAPVMGR